MFDEYINAPISDIKNGYSYDQQARAFKCGVCSAVFPADEIYKVDGRYYKSDKAAQLHVKSEHGGMLEVLCAGPKSETGLTDNQKELLRLISTGKTDRQIADAMGVSASTVRHQKFVFRQKVRQAKLLISVYELAQEGAYADDPNDVPVSIHKNAKMVDERYNVTEAEREKIINSVFSSLEPLKLRVFSAKEKKKLVALAKIAECFRQNRIYSEKEINEVLSGVFHDYVTLRRYLIEYGFLSRKPDGSEYWIND